MLWRLGIPVKGDRASDTVSFVPMAGRACLFRPYPPQDYVADVFAGSWNVERVSRNRGRLGSELYTCLTKFARTLRFDFAVQRIPVKSSFNRRGC